MNEIKISGAYCKDLVIKTEDIEASALEQLHTLSDTPVYNGLRIRVMPDVHSGKGSVIGFTCPAPQYLNPQIVGCDIGCGVECWEFDKPLLKEQYALFNMRVQKEIPMGKDLCEHGPDKSSEKALLNLINTRLHQARSIGVACHTDRFATTDELDKWARTRRIDTAVLWKALGTVGGGNHFIEYGETGGNTGPGVVHGAVTVHTGSRNPGLKVFNYWQNIADSGKEGKKVAKELEKEAKAVYVRKYGAIRDNKAFRKWMGQYVDERMTRVCPKGYLDGEERDGYLTDMVIMQAWADFNRKLILSRIAQIYCKLTGAVIADMIDSVHNYIDFRCPGGEPMIRKGAVRAVAGEKLIIPFNMRDGIAICTGKGNPEWNWSAPHGSGRKLARGKASRELTMEQYLKETSDLFSTTINESTLDESPMAYRSVGEVLPLISETCELVKMITPKISIKASGDCEIPRCWK